MTLTPKKVWFDQGNTPTERTIINDLITHYGLTQIIHENSYLLDCSSSCIDFIFISQDDLITNSRVQSSLISTCCIAFFPNPDYTKSALIVVFGCKRNKNHHLLLMIYNGIAKRVPFHEHFDLIFDSKFAFNKHFSTVLFKVNKRSALLQAS